MDEEIKTAYLRTFDTPHGQTVLKDMEARCYRMIRIDQHSSPVFMNPDAALYRAAQVDQINRIRGILEKAKG